MTAISLRHPLARRVPSLRLNAILSLTEVEVKRPTMREVLDAVAEVTEVDVDMISGPFRSKVCARPRMLAYYFMRGAARRSFPVIADYMGRNHSTVHNGCKRVREQPEEFEPYLSTLTLRFPMIVEPVLTDDVRQLS